MRQYGEAEHSPADRGELLEEDADRVEDFAHGLRLRHQPAPAAPAERRV
jgi:hypothetical protein